MKKHTNKNVSHKKSTEKMNYFSDDLNINVEYIKSFFVNCCDVEFRPVKLTINSKINAYIFYVNGMVDSSFVAENILKPLLQYDINIINQNNLHKEIYYKLLAVGSVEIARQPKYFVNKVLSGSVGILIENMSEAFSIEAIGWSERNVEEPQSETVVKGLRSGFVENIRINTSLVRRMIVNPSLKIERIVLGKMTNTEINVLYIDGIAEESLIKEVKSRVNRIDTDAILTVDTLQEMIEDSTFSVFNQSYSTERPDRVSSCLLEGKVIIFVNNSPFAIILPITISHYLQSAEDYNSRFIFASFTRILRFLCINLNLLLPGLYVAIFSYHHEMIPTALLKTISQAREELPFPIFLEMILLEIAFDMLREAGARLPRAVGQAVSIVGALVIGQAAVTARLVSPPSIIAVALTAICSFTIPTVEGSNAYRLLRYPILLAGGLFGLAGIISVLMVIFVHLSGLRSFGLPYLSPISPFILSDWKDSIVRFPMYLMKKRPKQTSKSNPIRQKNWKYRRKQ